MLVSIFSLEEEKLNFINNNLPDYLPEILWYWEKCVLENLDFSKVIINDKAFNFSQKNDFFDLSDFDADDVSNIGNRFDISDLNIVLPNFNLEIFGDVSTKTQIGTLLNSITHKRDEADVFGLFASFYNVGFSVYCAFTVCFVDKDTGYEMDIAVIEIGQDEEAYLLPIAVNEEALNFYNFNDIARISFWLGNFWAGTQYKMFNCPEKIHVVHHRGPICGNDSNYKEKNSVVLVEKVISIDENGNLIKPKNSGSGRKYRKSSWGVKGHIRKLKDGRFTWVRSYRKGKERDNSNVYCEKEYRYVDDVNEN